MIEIKGIDPEMIADNFYNTSSKSDGEWKM